MCLNDASGPCAKLKDRGVGLWKTPSSYAFDNVALTAYLYPSDPLVQGGAETCIGHLGPTSELQCAKNEMAFTELIYVSATAGDAEHEVKEILDSAVKHNQLNNITGMLLYHKGAFMQVLEGGESEVMETYARICDDKRHHHVEILSITEVRSRQFGNWSMGFKQVSATEITKFPQLAQIFDCMTRRGAITAPPGLALEMLSLFNTGMVWREAAKAPQL